MMVASCLSCGVCPENTKSRQVWLTLPTWPCSSGLGQTFTCQDSTTITCATTGTPGLPTALSGIALDRSAIELTWTAPNTSLAGIGDTRQYEVAYFVISSSGGANGTTETRIVASSNTLQAPPVFLQLTGLAVYTRYSFRIRAFAFDANNLLQPGTFTDEAIVQTAAGIPSEIVSVFAVAVNATAINVSWTAPTTPNGPLQNYTIRQERFDGTHAFYTALTNTTQVVLGATSNVLYFVHTGLEPYSLYTYSVVAFTTTGSTFGDVTATARTLASTPLRQPAPHAFSTGHSTITLAWNGPALPNGNLVRIDIVVASGSSLSRNISRAPADFFNPNNTLGIFTHTVIGLDSDTAYRFGIVSCVEDPYLCSEMSPLTTQETGTTTPSTATAIVIAVICVALTLISLGFVWEHERDRIAVKQWQSNSTLIINNEFQRSFENPDVLGKRASQNTILDDSDSGKFI